MCKPCIHILSEYNYTRSKKAADSVVGCSRPISPEAGIFIGNSVKMSSVHWIPLKLVYIEISVYDFSAFSETLTSLLSIFF